MALDSGNPPSGVARSRHSTPCAHPARKATQTLILGLALAFAALPAFGIDWSLKAFGTLAAIGSDTDKIAFRRDYSQDVGATSDWKMDVDSRLGLQLDADFNREFHAAVQWVARNHAGNFFEQNLEWAFLRWRPHDDVDVRLGRLGSDAFWLSDYRNVGYAYLWMRPPHEFYAPIFPYHFDGVDIAKKFTIGEGYLAVKGYAGYNLTDVKPINSDIFSVESILFGGSLVYESGNWRGRIGYAQLRPLTNILEHPTLRELRTALENPFINLGWPNARGLINDLSTQNKLLHYLSIGLAYDDGVWPIQAEASYIDSTVTQLPSMASAYLSVGRRFGSVTLYSLLGAAESMNQHINTPELLIPTPQLVDLRNVVNSLLNDNLVGQRSVSLGMRWDVYNNIAIKSEWSHIWQSSKGTLFWLDTTSPVPEQVNIWSFGVDFVF